MIKKAQRKFGLSLHQGDVRGLKERGLRTGTIGQKRRVGGEPQGGHGIAVQDGIIRNVKPGKAFPVFWMEKPKAPIAYVPEFALLGGNWYAIHQPSDLYEIYPKADNPLDIYDVYIGDTVLRTNPKPKLALPNIRSSVYLHFKTEKKGYLKALDGARFAELVALTDHDKDNTRYELLDGSGANGVDGDYYIKIYETHKPGDRVVINPAVETHFNDFMWNRGYQQIVNLGTGGKVYKENNRNSDEIRLRTMLHGNGMSIVENASDLTYNVILINKGSVDAKDIWTEVWPVTREIELNGVRGGISAEAPRDQIEAVLSGNDIVIRGNNYNKVWNAEGTGTSPPSDFKLGETKDGLVTELNNIKLRTITICTGSGTTSVNVLCTN